MVKLQTDYLGLTLRSPLIVRVKQVTRLPLAVKIGYYFTNLPAYSVLPAT